jgi:hypothetical protein
MSQVPQTNKKLVENSDFERKYSYLEIGKH